MSLQCSEALASQANHKDRSLAHSNIKWANLLILILTSDNLFKTVKTCVPKNPQLLHRVLHYSSCSTKEIFLQDCLEILKWILEEKLSNYWQWLLNHEELTEPKNYLSAKG